ncbi:hypothetical protein GCM10023074_29640 [Microbispora amethystogenes]|uniref:Uncharacterized protein n=1 Tax=Microbispora amethystogenes TaxID=1427754 RepID=A0ABQ4FAB6_9ACTN|nr:hypothetical protein Mam01_19110 [Microbispora amethystogenes]
MGSLAEPRRQGGRQWLDPRPDEVEPRLPRAVRPEPVVCSLLPERSGDEIRFDIRPAENGCSLHWTLPTPGELPEPAVCGAGSTS